MPLDDVRLSPAASVLAESLGWGQGVHDGPPITTEVLNRAASAVRSFRVNTLEAESQRLGGAIRDAIDTLESAWDEITVRDVVAELRKTLKD